MFLDFREDRTHNLLVYGTMLHPTELPSPGNSVVLFVQKNPLISLNTTKQTRPYLTPNVIAYEGQTPYQVFLPKSIT